MATTIQLRRGTAAAHSTFTGALGEITFDTTNKTLRAHDASVVGGTRLAIYDEVTDRLQVANANITFETKAVALAANTAQNNLINDRLQVANAAAIYSTLTQLGNTNSYIAGVQSALDTQEAKQASDLANTNSYIASESARIDLVNTNLTSTNTTIRSLISATNANVDQKLGSTATVTLTGDVTGSGSFSSNAVSIALTDTNLGNTNSYIATQSARIDLVNTNLTSTNTAIRALVSDRLQVANASSLFVNVSGDTMSGALAMGTNKITGLGTPTATADAATKGYVDTEVANIVDTAPETLNTLNELAAALGDDANFATTTAQTLGTKAANTYVNQTFVTKSTALTSNNAINARINATNANVDQKLGATASVTLTGAVTGSGSFSGNSISISTTATSDPTITLGGDLTGSVTLTNLGDGTLTASVVDDSHNHIISNVDGLQNELNSKIQVTNANAQFLRSANTTVTNDASSITTTMNAVDLNDEALVNPAGFLTINIGGTNYKLPFYS